MTQAMLVEREREFAFTLTRSTAGDGDGLDFEGYAAVFNSATHIEDRDGIYDEIIAPGAFKKTIAESTPKFLFNHGKAPLWGSLPIGTITELREDTRGLFVKARMFADPLFSALREAIGAGAVDGMSFRFEAIKDSWSTRGGEQLRTLREVRVPELGPVVFPAYSDTSAALRSLERRVLGTQTRATVETVSTEDQTVQNLVKAAIKDRLGLDETGDVLTSSFYEDINQLVFTVGGSKASDYSNLWQATYTYTDGVVTLIGDPIPVQPIGYEPRSSNKDSHMTTRSDVTFSDITEAVEDAIETLIGVDDVTSDVWMCDITDTWAVFSVWGALEETWPDYWKVDYTLDADGVATIGKPVHVEEVYVPTAVPPARCTDLRKTATRIGTSAQAASRTSAEAATTTSQGTSTEAATRTSTEAAATETRAPRGQMTTLAEREAFLREVELRRRGIKVGA